MSDLQFVFRLNDTTVQELEAIRDEAVALALSVEAMPEADFQRMKPLFDKFFQVLERVNSNLVLVDACRQRGRVQ